MLTYSTGGCEDSAIPRKVHVWDAENRRTVCGQTFQHVDRGEVHETRDDYFVGTPACKKCLRKIRPREGEKRNDD